MEQTAQSVYRDVAPDILTPGDIKVASDFLDNIDLQELETWAKNRTKTMNYDGQDFRMVIDQPVDGNNEKAVVVLSEFGTGIVPRLSAKSRIIRDMVDPEASLVIQPNTINGQPNMNFTNAERKELSSGNAGPILGRIAVSMCFLGNPKGLTIVGLSQGAGVGLEYASRSKNPVSLAFVEPPNVTNRSNIELSKDFLTSGKDLLKVVEANFDDQESPFAVMTKASTKILGLGKFAYQAAHLDNMAMMGLMKKSSAELLIEKTLKNGSNVVHVWGENEDVSPVELNRAISNRFGDNSNYSGVELKGVGHSITDFYALNGALARLASNSNTRLS